MGQECWTNPLFETAISLRKKYLQKVEIHLEEKSSLNYSSANSIKTSIVILITISSFPLSIILDTSWAEHSHTRDFL
jgi:hypothetical protein